ncbi:hypothetical protein [Bradyrhizobium archetypum]|uniref:Uncharacterized protein n=1 Tax=Bradyrhizobium archetypum TaxID=2721160 RepID=A0A7Y4H9F8_9BRAD|nr:hypothetical protein [Bradyrhizobium archetypum]NOJ50030.1 hypothetical protein [Bradyrhizobium archetypum]
MLPGFRFLFAAIVLSMSILIFGLGAAALLRAAHEEFANLPSRRAAPEPMFARQSDDPPPTLALLRIDPPVAEKPADNVLPAVVPEAAWETPVQAAPIPDVSSDEPEKLAAARPSEPVPAEAARPETPPKEATAETLVARPAPAAFEAPAANAEVKLAAIAETPQPAAVPPAPDPAADIYSFEDNPAASRIATLGGPAVIVDEKTAAKTMEAKPDRSAIRKRAAERARERRRVAAQRAQLAREAALAQQQLQANPFAQLQAPRATR